MNKKHSSVSSSASFFWKYTILALALMMNVTLAYRLFHGEQSVAVWRSLKATSSHLEGELHNLDLRRTELSREIRLLQTDSAYLEKIIRQRLNYVRSNEILYLLDEAKPDNTIWAGTGPNGSRD